MLPRILQVLEITIPIFAMIALGWQLRRRTWITAEATQVMNRLVAHLSLPAIIFVAVSKTPFTRLIHGPVLAASFLPIGVGLAVSAGLAMALGVRGAPRAVLLYAPFWGNVSYMGIPLAGYAFGEKGKQIASIINAFAMPCYVVLGSLLLSCNAGSAGDLRRRIRSAFFNPIVLSAFAGIGVSLFMDLGGGRNLLAEHTLLKSGLGIGVSFLNLLGKLGLPLALLLIGASLNLQGSVGALRATFAGCACRLILTPLVSYLTFRLLFPQVAADEIGACVLVHATPVAVASYVISSSMKVAEETACALVVWTTLLSVLTIPVWTYLLLG